jgi:hypothetical protein
MHSQKRIVIDASDVAVFSSSFADEVFGKLFVEFGAVAFMSTIELRNFDKTLRTIIDRAIAQRAASAPAPVSH